MTALVRITARPEGEAPAWVRDCWIGVELPLVTGCVINSIGFGVLSIPNSLVGQLWAQLRGRSQRMEGYLVKSAVAIEILGTTSPAAAEWWHEHTPQLLRPRECFLFDTACGEIVPASS